MIKISKKSDQYPYFVKDLPNHPDSIYFSKLPEFNFQNNIVFIGSRNMSPYGRDVCKEIVGNLCVQKFTIVSGMAEGVDHYCHRLALTYGSSTIGILGYGFNFLDSNSYKNRLTRSLAKDMLQNEQSNVVSPFEPSQFPTRETFLERNKVLASFAPTTVVIEAAERSGTFSTVSAAISLNRAVFAVPGSIFSYNSRGCHDIINEGAVLLKSVDDILNNLSKV